MEVAEDIERKPKRQRRWYGPGWTATVDADSRCPCGRTTRPSDVSVDERGVRLVCSHCHTEIVRVDFGCW